MAYTRISLSRRMASSMRSLYPERVNHTLAESEILSAWHILALSKIPENSVITDISFGYKRE